MLQKITKQIIKRKLISDLKRVEKTLIIAVKNDDKYIQSAAEHLIRAGGKRIRPKLLLLSYYLTKFKDEKFETPEKVIKACVSVELVHLATLYHDDIMDKANYRRGVLAAHKVFGENIAILIGDYLFACAFKISADLDNKIILEQSKTLYKLCIGQIHDIQNENLANIKIDNYLQILSDKTAELIACSMFTGAMLGGAPTKLIKQLKLYGINYGIAFQLKDDILDLEKNTGKPIGTDLKKRLPTIVSISIMQSKNKKLKKLVNSKFLKYKNVEKIASKIKKSSVYHDITELLFNYVNKSKKVLSSVPDSVVKDILIKYTDDLIAR